MPSALQNCSDTPVITTASVWEGFKQEGGKKKYLAQGADISSYLLLTHAL